VEEGAPEPVTPEGLHAAYALPATTVVSSTQTIAIVDAYNDPAAEADLATYDQEFKLPACTHVNGCFTQVGQTGTATLPFPKSKQEKTKASAEERTAADEWALEISTDIEAAHTICQDCRIVLVEANSPLFSDLEVAENTSVALGANEISDSWGSSECGLVPLECQPDTAAYDHPGVVIAAAAGDFGYLDWGAEGAEHGYTDYPASSPHVISVGGTRLTQIKGGWQETVWNGQGAGGGGCSVQFPAPLWQQGALRGRRLSWAQGLHRRVRRGGPLHRHLCLRLRIRRNGTLAGHRRHERRLADRRLDLRTGRRSARGRIPGAHPV
jgi:subtilase family serine protease